MTNVRIICDNTSLSTPISSAVSREGEAERKVKFAINCNRSEALQSIASDGVVDVEVLRYLQSSMAENTQRAYRSDLQEFHRWGGTIPVSPETVARYLADRAETLSPFTLARRLVVIARVHKAGGYANPCDSELVKTTMRGIRRVHGLAQRQVEPILREDLLMMLELLPNTTRGIRDRALLLIGFCGAFRRSEIAQIQFDDVRFVPEGLTVRLPRSKTDQEGKGRLVAIPWARSKICAVRSLKAWNDHAAISAGAIFRQVNKGGRVLSHGISGSAIAKIVKEHAARAGLNAEKISGHSLRAGLVTSAAKLGASSWKIRQQTGHRTDTMLRRYVRDADLFCDNAAGAVL